MATKEQLDEVNAAVKREVQFDETSLVSGYVQSVSMFRISAQQKKEKRITY